jgi:hypothetical protein
VTALDDRPVTHDVQPVRRDDDDPYRHYYEDRLRDMGVPLVTSAMSTMHLATEVRRAETELLSQIHHDIDVERERMLQERVGTFGTYERPGSYCYCSPSRGMMLNRRMESKGWPIERIGWAVFSISMFIVAALCVLL